MPPTTRPARRRGRPRDATLASRRREEILGVATRLFAERGFPSTDVQVAADALGVGKGTVYRYFPTKSDLFLAAVDRAMRLLKEHIDEAAAAVVEPLAQVSAAIHAYLRFFDAHPEFVELLIQERAAFKDRKKPTYFVHREANIGRWQALFRALIAEGVVRDVPVERITDVMGDALYGAMFTNYFAGRRRAPGTQAEELLDVVLHGILTPAGRRRCGGRRAR
jgi:AcrR family transcriptional regulator